MRQSKFNNQRQEYYQNKQVADAIKQHGKNSVNRKFSITANSDVKLAHIIEMYEWCEENKLPQSQLARIVREAKYLLDSNCIMMSQMVFMMLNGINEYNFFFQDDIDAMTFKLTFSDYL